LEEALDLSSDRILNNMKCHSLLCPTQWPHRLRRCSAAARLLGLWVLIPPGTWMPVPCECCVLSGRCLCDGLITRPEESYKVWCVLSECHRETSILRRPCPTGGGDRCALGEGEFFTLFVMCV